MAETDTESQIDQEDLNASRILEETKQAGKRKWEKAVKASAEMRTKKRLLKEEQMEIGRAHV